ncbi:aspartate aminotransferase family protein [Paralimibaculum aggregatum]|uniref:Aspartate aminotransferase family protein n=2 Tax=Paralimibaculum aggregatum TaxID=3036245 RepID=A0ABQ6LMJ9_9RHOB|nr:aspartate aminotransferase family protein [Limibaculum sp. NKW23]
MGERAMNHILPRAEGVRLPVVAGGEGCYLIDTEGRRYLDGSGGAAVSCLGHGDPDIIAAIKAQLDRVAFAHTGFFTSEPAEALADLLVETAPGDLSRVYFLSGGSEAAETAIKIARQHWVARGEPGRHRLIAREQSYHGNTLGALAAGGNPARKAPYAPLLAEMHHIPPCHHYRHGEPGESAEDYGRRAADALEAEILRLGPETVMAFMAETVSGATLGCVPPAPGYFRRIREICDRYGVLLILDEVMCGMGRTGTLWACEQDGVAPDIATIAKGLGGGYQPIGAMLCTEAVYAPIVEAHGAFQHGHTYIGHPTATAAGLAVLTKLTRGGLAARAAEIGAVLREKLEARFGQHPNVGDIRGRGMFQGIEIVADRESKAPFPRARGVAPKIKKAAMRAGLICYPAQGTADGQAGDHVLLAPPFIIEPSQIDELTDKLETAITEAI